VTPGLLFVSGFFLAHTLASLLCLGREPKAKVATLLETIHG